MTDNCANCRFVKKPALVLDTTALACKRNPPMPMLIPGRVGLEMKFVYPSVTGKDWCGQHEPDWKLGAVEIVDAIGPSNENLIARAGK